MISSAKLKSADSSRRARKTRKEYCVVFPYFEFCFVCLPRRAERDRGQTEKQKTYQSIFGIPSKPLPGLKCSDRAAATAGKRVRNSPDSAKVNQFVQNV